MIIVCILVFDRKLIRSAVCVNVIVWLVWSIAVINSTIVEWHWLLIWSIIAVIINLTIVEWHWLLIWSLAVINSTVIDRDWWLILDHRFCSFQHHWMQLVIYLVHCYSPDRSAWTAKNFKFFHAWIRCVAEFLISASLWWLNVQSIPASIWWLNLELILASLWWLNRQSILASLWWLNRQSILATSGDWFGNRFLLPSGDWIVNRFRLTSGDWFGNWFLLFSGDWNRFMFPEFPPCLNAWLPALCWFDHMFKICVLFLRIFVEFCLISNKNSGFIRFSDDAAPCKNLFPGCNYCSKFVL